jgi:uncharacterized membrane protein YdbT with pleckstrin-like domain
MVNYFLVGVGIGLNIFLLMLYYVLHKQIEKFGAVKEKVIMAVKRARRSYFLSYFVIMLMIVGVFFVRGDFRIILISLIVAFIIILDILHDGRRLVLTEYELVVIKGFFNTKVTMVEYKDIVIVELKDSVMGRILGYGDLFINVYGTKNISFKRMPNILKIKNIIEERKIKHERE